MPFPSLACRIAVIVIGLLPVLSVPSMASPGGLNAEGCHTNRKTGEYHCHRKGAAAKTPVSGKMMLLDSGSQPFANCAAARAAGAAPVRLGDPGYSPRLDRDGDGIGCE